MITGLVHEERFSDKLLIEMSEIRQNYSSTRCSNVSNNNFVFTFQHAGTRQSSHLTLKQGDGSLIKDGNNTIMNEESFRSVFCKRVGEVSEGLYLNIAPPPRSPSAPSEQIPVLVNWTKRESLRRREFRPISNPPAEG